MREKLACFYYFRKGVRFMNPRTLDALEEEKQRLFRRVRKTVATKYEGMKDSVKENILDESYYYLKQVVHRMTDGEKDDPNFENSVDYQLVNALEYHFTEWFEENFNEVRVNELNNKAR